MTLWRQRLDRSRQRPIEEPVEPPADPPRDLVKAGRYEQALEQLARTLAENPDDPDAVKLAAQANAGRGALSEGSEHAVHLARLTQRPADWWSARKLTGKMRETSEQWQPVVTAPRPTGSPTGRVLYLAQDSRPFLNNGSCVRTHESLSALLRTGHDVLGVTMPGFPGSTGVADPPAQSVLDDVVYRHLLPRGGELRQRLAPDEYDQLAAQALAGLVARERPSMLHVAAGRSGFGTALVGEAVARWAGIPWVYEVRSFSAASWTQNARYQDRGEYRDRRVATDARMMRTADVVLASSDAMRDEIVDTYGVPAERVRVVPGAVDAERFAPRPRNGLAGGMTIGYVSGSARSRDRPPTVIKAVARLRGQGREVTGLIVGDVPRRGWLEKVAREGDVAEHITFTGPVAFERMPDYYAQMGVLAAPTGSLSAFEATAMGIPVLAADDSLVGAVTRLMDNPPEQAAVAERSWQAVADELSQVYGGVVC